MKMKHALSVITKHVTIIACTLSAFAHADSFIQPIFNITESPNITRAPKGKEKDWTFIVYVAADNDLRGFAARNIRQLARIGSNSRVNIVVHLDIRMSGNQKVTRRYYIENGRVIHVNQNDPSSQRMDSGLPSTLISCCKWALEDYPAKDYALIFWNHGTGIIDPIRGRVINPTELFSFNPLLNRLELDRSIGFIDFISQQDRDERGICWDDSSGNYLNNQALDSALNTIRTQYMNGKKFSIIGFDACLMSMLEVCNNLKNHAHIMVGSQEVELGTGWDYKGALQQFSSGSPDKYSLATNIVHSFGNVYQNITYDYTQSAINLDQIDILEKNVNNVSMLLLQCLRKQSAKKVYRAIKASRNRLVCTHFDEPSYIDLHHFYSNLLSNLKYFAFANSQEGERLKAQLKTLLEEGKQLIKNAVVANTAGKNLRLAQGISIYFPERRIHPSYRKTTFAASNEWIHFLNQYLLL